MQTQTQIIAHRGFWQTEPPTSENSLQSLENARGLNIYGTEFDVRMSKDGVLIIYHDEHYDSLEISETNFADLEKLKLKNGENIPTLKDFLEKGKNNPSLKLVIELKPISSGLRENELVQKAVQLVKTFQMESQCEFISFSLNICEQLKKEEPTFKVKYLNGDLSPLEIKQRGFDGFSYHYSVFITNPGWISQAKMLGLITNSWTVNDTAVFEKLKMQGIDFVTTDIPNQLLHK
ncbi:glycerophosphodiester phosphodiesterase family protein [Chryseobacterium gotjawalense]|uniref:Glycerophosphodiester phosphodiesterase family protein n=1 Tax=Chryseobacterium gotjawalense TaxID=3042315 RepID=A0ABY8RFK4_9FLAO|nr:glycerophosphodiester phosphodiesterase family protein [Chryseobacterium sp. wdc7]WHF51802.1 glycerophosphodiester phosphodiesterase family protein [Chryseobacterium sp. wdc7]